MSIYVPLRMRMEVFPNTFDHSKEDLCDNLLSGLIQSLEEGASDAIEWAVLSNNRISKLEPLLMFTNVKCLNLNDNNLTEVNQIYQLTNLTRLSLRNNKLTCLPSKMNRLLSLKVFQLSGNTKLPKFGKEERKQLDYFTGRVIENEDFDEVKTTQKALQAIAEYYGPVEHARQSALLFIWMRQYSDELQTIPKDVCKLIAKEIFATRIDYDAWVGII